MSIVMIGAVLLLSGISRGYAQSPDTDRQAFNKLQTMKIELSEAINSADREVLSRLDRRLTNLRNTGDRELKKFVYYYLGYTNYRLSSLFREMDEDRKKARLDQAIRYLHESTRLAPTFAEAWALLSSCYGMKATGMFSGLKYGPKSEKAIAKGLELEPENPRVVMVKGIGLMHKPAMFGGSTEKAIETFRRAGELFREWTPPGKLYPEWGHAENYAWMAQAYIQMEQYSKSYEAYQLSLEVEPDYYWVKELLLPELKEKLARSR